MAGNVFTQLIPVFYEALDVVAREQQGAIMAANRDTKLEQAAVGQTIRSPITQAQLAVDIAPGAYAPDSGQQTIDYVDMTISKAKSVSIKWSGEEQIAIGGLFNPVLVNQFAQAFRTLSNMVETDLIAEAVVNASRAVGAAGTSPFATAGNLSGFAAPQQVLDDNGAPESDRHLIIGSKERADIFTFQSNLTRVNEAGSAELLRKGILMEVDGLDIGVSKQIKTHTPGTGTLYVANGGNVVGDTGIAVKTGSGTVLAGDVVTFAGDTNQYVVNTGIAAPGTLAIGKPGLIQTLADGDAMTIGAAYRGNIAFHRSALQLVARAPFMPMGGDMATDVTMVQDEKSGLVFQIAMYRQYRQVHIEVSLAWGVKATKPEFITILQG